MSTQNEGERISSSSLETIFIITSNEFSIEIITSFLKGFYRREILTKYLEKLKLKNFDKFLNIFSIKFYLRRYPLIYKPKCPQYFIKLILSKISLFFILC